MTAAERRVARAVARIAAAALPPDVTATAGEDRVTIAGPRLAERSVTDPALTAIGWRAGR